MESHATLQDINFQSIFESLPGNYLIVSPDPPTFTIIAVSKDYTRATMTNKNDMLNKGVFEVFPDNPDDPNATGVANLSASLQYVIDHRKWHKMPVQKYDIQLPDGNGFEERYWSPCNTPVLDTDGSLLYIIHQVDDVTQELKTADALENQAEILRRTNEELEQFVRISSHDLQEPLRKIRTYAGMVRMTASEDLDAAVLQRMDKISESAERMSLRLKALLKYAYLRKEDSFSLVNLQDVFDEVCDDLELLIEEKKAVLKVEPLPVITGIRHQLHQLLYNLLFNALKFTKDDQPPVIKVSSRKTFLPDFTSGDGQQYHEIVISDNGIGFDQQHAERIFTVFERLHGSDYTGIGIGLALCRKVVHNLGGEIYAHGEPGKGASFHVVLPIK